MKKAPGSSGFTLIEVLVTLAITSLIISAAVAVFINLQSASSVIDQRANLSVNIRGAMYFIEENIRLMGFNPEEDMSNHFIVSAANKGELIFTRNDIDNLTLDKTIRIGLKLEDDKAGGLHDGIADKEDTSLVIDSQNVADNIVAIGFGYGFDGNGDNAVDLSPRKNVIWAIDTDDDGRLDKILDTDDDGKVDLNDGPPSTMAVPVDISRIRVIKIWLLARTKHPVKSHKDNMTYKLGGNQYVSNNHFVHSLHTTTVRCRNML